jgi:hypothetical protein
LFEEVAGRKHKDTAASSRSGGGRYFAEYKPVEKSHLISNATGPSRGEGKSLRGWTIQLTWSTFGRYRFKGGVS